MRFAGMKEPGAVDALEEVISAALISGAALHVVHISSTGLRATPELLQMIAEAGSRGLDVTTECYPYTATQTPMLISRCSIPSESSIRLHTKLRLNTRRESSTSSLLL